MPKNLYKNMSRIFEVMRYRRWSVANYLPGISNRLRAVAYATGTIYGYDRDRNIACLYL